MACATQIEGLFMLRQEPSPASPRTTKWALIKHGLQGAGSAGSTYLSPPPAEQLGRQQDGALASAARRGQVVAFVLLQH